jgi:hypothetical protein
MRSTRLLTMLVSLAMLGLPALVLTAGPASAIDYSYTSEVVIDDPGTRTYRSALVITGQVIADDGAGGGGWVDGAPVTLFRQWKGAETWTEIGSTATSTVDGEFVFNQVAEKNATYKVTYAGQTIADGPDNYIVAGSESQRSVYVARDLQATDVQKGNRLYLKGNVNPGWGGKVIKMQRKTCKSCPWKVYDKQRTGDNGSWKFRVGAPRNGFWYFRAQVAGTSDYLKSRSGVFRTYSY